MIRVLFLLDADADFQAARGAAALLRGLGAAFSTDVRTVGRGGTYSNAATAGLRLRSNVDHDVIHAWGGRALAAAVPGKRPVIFTPAADVRRRTVGWLRAVLTQRAVETVCPSATLHRGLVERGIPPERCHRIRPGVDFSRVRRRRDDALREALGFGPADRVLLAAGESTRAAGHDLAAWAATILHFAEPSYRLLLWGRGPMVTSLGHFLGKTETRHVVSIAEQRLGRRVDFEELLPAADAVVVAARGSVSTLPIAIAMAAGLPIVSTVTYTAGELLEDRHTALMAPPNNPRLLARRVLDLYEDPSLQWSIADMARTEAFEYFSQTRFLDQWRTVYRQVASGERVEVPEQPPGAGLRFHGRG